MTLQETTVLHNGVKMPVFGLVWKQLFMRLRQVIG